MNSISSLSGAQYHLRVSAVAGKTASHTVTANETFAAHLTHSSASSTTRQNLDAERQSIAPTRTSITTASTQPVSADPFGPFGVSQAASTPAKSTSSPATMGSHASATPTATPSFDDAYWASQPPPVQALRTISDPDQRAQAATQLASQGYSIDVPIMVWGWDPQVTMQLRQDYGYTWVPSAQQASIQIAPGLGVPGMNSYNSAAAPAGAIKVSTNVSDFTTFQSV